MSFPKYEAYKDSGVEWLGEVPVHWTLSPLKRLSELITTKATDTSWQVGLENIESWSGQFLDTESEFAGDGIAFSPNDILFGKLRPYLAKVYLAEKSGEAVGDFFVLRPHEISANYLHRFILSPSVINTLNASTIGAKMPRVSWEYMGGIPVVFPGEEEQTQITQFLDHETTRIDALIAEQERLIALLKEKRQAVISHAVTKGCDPSVPMKDSGVEWLGEVPEHWKVSPLKHLVKSIQMGPFGSSLTDLSNMQTGFKLYGQENYISGDFEKGDRWVSETMFAELHKYELLPDDLVFTRKGSIGNCRLVPSHIARGIIDSDSIRVRVDSAVVEHRFLQLLAHEAWYILEQLQSERRGAVLSGLNTSNIANLRIVVPPLTEQKFLFEFVQAELARMTYTLNYATDTVSLLQERRSALISAAVTGKIDVRNWQPPISTFSTPALEAVHH